MRSSEAPTRLLVDAATCRGVFFLSHNVANALNYAFLLAMSQAFAPREFALFAAFFGAVYLTSALANSVQTTVAAQVAAATGETRFAAAGAAVRTLLLFALPFSLAVVLAARPAANFLHSDTTTPAVLAGASIWLSLFAAAGYGALQGAGRFALLGAGLIVASAGRLALGLAFVWFGLGVSGALLAVALGLALSAALVVAPFAGHAARALPPGARMHAPAVLGATLLASVAIALPTSADVVLVGHYFPADEAGAYAAVSVLGKIVIFGPYAVSLTMFPRFVQQEASGRSMAPLVRQGLLVTAGVAVPLALAVLAAGALVPDLTLRGYDVAPAFLLTYLAAMVAFSFQATLLYALVARRRTAAIAAAVFALAVELAIVALWHPSALAVAGVLLAGNLAMLALGFTTHGLLERPRVAAAPRRVPLRVLHD